MPAQTRSLRRCGSAQAAERSWERQSGATGASSASDPEKLSGVPALVRPLLGTNGLSESLGPPNSLPPPCFSAGCGCGRARKAKSVVRTLMCDPAARRAAARCACLRYKRALATSTETATASSAFTMATMRWREALARLEDAGWPQRAAAER